MDLGENICQSSYWAQWALKIKGCHRPCLASDSQRTQGRSTACRQCGVMFLLGGSPHRTPFSYSLGAGSSGSSDFAADRQLRYKEMTSTSGEFGDQPAWEASCSTCANISWHKSTGAPSRVSTRDTLSYKNHCTQWNPKFGVCFRQLQFTDSPFWSRCNFLRDHFYDHRGT